MMPFNKGSLQLVLAVLIKICFINTAVFASPSLDLLGEVQAAASTPRYFDWRQENFSVEFSRLIINERNNFESTGISFALRKTFEHRYLGLAGVRQIKLHSTKSTEMLSMTPYLQAAQPSRLELFALGGLPLMAGRSLTILSPWFPDLEHALYLKMGGHYSFYNHQIKWRSEPPPSLHGQRIVVYHSVFESGLRLQVSIPYSLSFFVDYDYYYPVSGRDSDLSDWTSFGGGLSWSF